MKLNSDSSDYQEVRAVPSVSRDRWLEHARKKLEKGYALIVSDQRRNANFHMAGKGYETCPHKTALQLIKQGVVKKAGRHHLGTMYFLSGDARIIPPAPSPRIVDEDDSELEETASEYEDLVDELEDTEVDLDNAEDYEEEDLEDEEL